MMNKMKLELDHVMLQGHKTRFNHQSRHNGATTCNVSLPQGGYTATRLVVPQLDLVVVPPIRPSAYL